MGLDIGLYPKQGLALTTPANEILYGGAVGGGKELDVNTPILTISGWKTVGSIVVGDQVFDEQGQPCFVIAKSKVDRKSKTYRMDFGSACSINCDARHEWATYTRSERHYKKDKPPTPRTTLEIKGTLRAEKGKRCNHSIPMTKPLQFPTSTLPIDPYILGVFLSGGMVDKKASRGMCLSARCTSSKITLSVFDEGAYYNKQNWYSLLHSVGLRDISSKDLFIPEIYKWADEYQRLELIKGIMDVRGTLRTNGHGAKTTSGEVEVYTDGYQLCKDIHDVMLTLGQKSHMYERVDSKHNDCNWRVRCYANRILFKSKSRAQRQQNTMRALRTTEQNYYIKDVKHIKHCDMQCIYVDSPSNCYLAGDHLVPTHNSYLMRVAAILWAMECPGIQIYLFRLTRKELDDNHMVGPGGFYDLLGDAVNTKYIKINNSDHTITFRNGKNNSYINGSCIHLCHCQHEDDKYLYRGAEMHVLMIDEVTLFTWSKYAYLRTRVRIPKTWKPPQAFTDKWGEKFFPRILLGSNPGGRSHNQFKREFIKISDPFVITQMSKKRGGMRRQFIPARLDDNPSLDKEEYEGRVMAVGDEATARMLLEGDWDAVAGGMFDDIWDEEVHMIKPFVIPDSWYVDRTFDWGSYYPFSVGWWAQSDGTEVRLEDNSTIVYPKGTLFRIAEWYGAKDIEEDNVGLGLTPYEIGYGIKQIEQNRSVFKTVNKVYPGPADKQIWNSNPKHDSIYSSNIQEINAGYYSNDSYRLFNIFTQADQTAGSRARGWVALRTHLKNSLKFPTIDRAGVFFFKTCPTANNILPSLIRHETKIDDIADGQEDHMPDDARYRMQHTIHRTKHVGTTMG